MSLEHLVVSENEKMLKKKKAGRTSQGHKNQPDNLTELPMTSVRTI